MDDVANGDDGRTKDHQVHSYGITINTSDIQSLSVLEQGDELKALDVDVYEQKQFEDGIIQQVDSAFSKAEKNFRQTIIQQEIKNLEKELRAAQDEKDEIENIFSSAKQGIGNATKKVSFSLLQQKQSKENEIKRIQDKIHDSKTNLKNILLAEKEGDATDILGPSSAHTDSVRLGEITPFEALKQQKLIQNTAESREHPTAQHIPVSDTRLVKKTSDKGLHKKKRTKRKHYFLTDDDDGSEEESKQTHSDDEFVPEKDALTDEEEYLQDDHVLADEEDLTDSYFSGNDVTNISKNNKNKSSKKKEKVKDDGDFSLFRERMRKFQVRKKLKEACQNGEVVEEYDSSDFSDIYDSDDDVTVEDEFVLPHRLWDKLYKYQRIGVKWLWQLHSQQVGGIIGDEMGLGKTIQTISFLAGLDYSKNSKSRKVGVGPVLIVCPATVMQQWVAEFHKWWPKFRVGILHISGTFSGRKETLIRAIHNHPGILITSYAGVRMNKKELYRYHWDYVILDEGHKIRNPDSDITLACKQFDTPHRIILTGTPMQNSLKELWSLFDFVYPGRLGTLPVFMSEFSIPITMGGYANASAVQVQTAYKCSVVLRDTVAPYLLRRLKKDVQMVIALPAKNEQVLFCKLTDEQTEVYKDYINSKDVLDIFSGRLKVFVGLIKLRKICNHPDLLYLQNPTKEELSTNDKTLVSKEFENGYGHWKRSGKMVVVENLLKIWKEQNHRVLLFSQSKQMLNIMESFVVSMGYTYDRMDGSTNIGGRQMMVKRFNEDKSIFVFLLTTRVGGLGLNLIGADRIIIFDPDWNPSTDTQARERSWRIGQDRPVTIYRLMTTGTIEEKIYHRQIFKQFLTNRVLTNPFQRRFFKSNDLHELFTLGDIGPLQSTETGALFAGTGSEIRLRRKGDTLKGKGKSVSESKNGKSSNSLKGNTAKKTSIKELKSSLSSPVKLSAEKQKTQVSGKKRKLKRKKRKVSVDGVHIGNIAKSEVYRNQDSEEDGDSKAEKKEKTKTESKNDDDVLLRLFQSSGLHSALKHDRIEQAGNDDYLLVEKEAEKVAKQAAKALRKSRAECKVNGLSVPTWTGTTTTSDQKKKPRFGAKRKKVEPITTTTIDSSSHKSNAVSTTKNGVDVSSSALLARMRNRTVEPTSSSRPVTTNNIAAVETLDSAEELLLKDIHEFISQKRDQIASTDEITTFFKERLKDEQSVLFKQLLKQICVFERQNNIGHWRLKSDI